MFYCTVMWDMHFYFFLEETTVEVTAIHLLVLESAAAFLPQSSEKDYLPSFGLAV